MKDYPTKKQLKQILKNQAFATNRFEQIRQEQRADLKHIIALDNKIKELQNIIDSVRKKYPVLKDLTIDDIKLLIKN